MRSFIRTRRMCEWEDFARREAFARDRLSSPQGALLPPFLLLAEPGFTAAEQRVCAEQWMRERLIAGKIDRNGLDFAFAAPERGKKIRLGYLSNDFQDHATAFLLIEALEARDPASFELHAYSFGADDGGAMRGRLRRAFDSFHDITALTNVEAAQAIHRDGIDILVDLKGFTEGTRTAILALRPAPIQVNYLGYPGTLGPGLCDYMITDAFCTPPGAAADYDEVFACLPHSYQPHGRGVAVGPAPGRAEAGLPPDGFVFCCFNQSFKFTPAVFDIWCRLLDSAPGSVLWLLASREAEGNLRNEARRRGVDGARLIFAPHLPQAAHLARLQLADLVLDTAPYGAHTTASDALFVGAPVVTRPGATFASRVAGSLLLAAGLPELVAATDEAYFALALDLATDRERIGALRRKLSGNHAPLFDTPAYVRALEALYSRMWARYCDGAPPAALMPEGSRP